MSRRRPHQMPRAQHAFIGRRLQEVDGLLWHLISELGRVYGVDSRPASKADQARRALLSLRLDLEGKCEREYGAEDTTLQAYFRPLVDDAPGDRPPWMAPPE